MSVAIRASPAILLMKNFASSFIILSTVVGNAAFQSEHTAIAIHISNIGALHAVIHTFSSARCSGTGGADFAARLRTDDEVKIVDAK